MDTSDNWRLGRIAISPNEPWPEPGEGLSESGILVRCRGMHVPPFKSKSLQFPTLEQGPASES